MKLFRMTGQRDVCHSVLWSAYLQFRKWIEGSVAPPSSVSGPQLPPIQVALRGLSPSHRSLPSCAPWWPLMGMSQPTGYSTCVTTINCPLLLCDRPLISELAARSVGFSVVYWNGPSGRHSSSGKWRHKYNVLTDFWTTFFCDRSSNMKQGHRDLSQRLSGGTKEP
jgi:hypothetical protein